MFISKGAYLLVPTLQMQVSAYVATSQYKCKVNWEKPVYNITFVPVCTLYTLYHFHHGISNPKQTDSHCTFSQTLKFGLSKTNKLNTILHMYQNSTGWDRYRMIYTSSSAMTTVLDSIGLTDVFLETTKVL